MEFKLVFLLDISIQAVIVSILLKNYNPPMSLKKLKKEKEILEDELYNLHFVQLDPEKYNKERLNIELKILRVESLIQYNKNLLPFKYTLYASITIMIIAFVSALVISILE